VVVAAAGPVDEAVLLRAAEAAFGTMPRGEPNTVPPPVWHGGVKLRRMSGSGQCQIVLGFEAPPLADDHHVAYVLAAALLGEGMSSPLLDEIRERRGLAYHVACAADVLPHAGQVVIDAATDPHQADAFLTETARLLQQQADRVDATGLARARNQITVRTLRALEHPAKRLEAAAQELFALDRLRDPQVWLTQLQAVAAQDIRGVFQRMVASRAAIGLAGSVTARARQAAEAFGSAR
jgi:predicted Zn-dependent peptidase